MDNWKEFFFDLDEEPETLVDILRWRGEHQANKIAYTYLEDGDKKEIPITYGELDQKARAIAATLQKQNMQGERVLLLYPPGLEYVAGFMGCLYAGAIAVPAYPPDPSRLSRTLPRLEAIVQDAEAKMALTTGQIMAFMKLIKMQSRVAGSVEKFPLLKKAAGFMGKKAQEMVRTRGLEKIRWIATDKIKPEVAKDWKQPPINAETLAFLQYTSGSTGNPKGVMLSHRNLIHNSRLIHFGFGFTRESKGVIWLPMYHDMGLIGGVLQPLCAGMHCTLMSPLAFLQWPVRWLKVISRVKDGPVISGGPNFAYELCVRRVSERHMKDLDLSNWRVAFSGAEPVRAETIEKFTQTFAKVGFKKEAFYPCYGLAEATLFVTGGLQKDLPIYLDVRKSALQNNRVELAEPQTENDRQTLVGCGRELLDQRVEIVDPETFQILPEDAIGEIWVKSPSVANGYWRNPEATRETFGATTANGEGPFLRTGDLGFKHKGELFVTGRLKDLIIIRGQNHYPQDIEYTVEQSHPAIRAGCVAAFSIEVAGEERLVVVSEVRKRQDINLDDAVAAVRSAIAEVHNLQPYAVVFIKARTIPKTSSGKIRRRATREQYLNGELDILLEWRAGKQDDTIPEPVQPPTTVKRHEVVVPEKGQVIGIQDVERWLIKKLASILEISEAEIDTRQSFANYGLDSAQAVSISGELEEWLGISLPPTLLYDYPTIESLAKYLVGQNIRPGQEGQNEKAAPTVKHPGFEAYNDEPIAIVGMGARMPGAPNLEAFWELLHNGVDAITEVPPERWDVEKFYDPNPGTPGKMVTRWGGFINDVDKFDAHFFGISPREAVRMDPQQRLLLEVTWEALEHAGIVPQTLAGSKTGVFVGIGNHDYSLLQHGDVENMDPYVGTGNALSIAANRISYLLDLRGPSVAMDTACSSALVAVHMACESLRRGDSALALAGGVNVILSPELTITFSQARMMSPTGRCKTFDASADGYVRGEGAGMVVLKRLSDARRDGDRILAIIRGSAVNQDGRSNGITAPNRHAQVAVIRDALERAGVTPSDIDYVEAHGTGTILGDPIEVQALGEVYKEYPRQVPCYIASVKTNIGHLETAAGIAGLIKIVLAMQHEEIPPHLHFKKINPHIPIDELPFQIPVTAIPWKKGNKPRMAAVSSYGFGGTNAHLIVQEGEEPSVPENEVDRDAHVLTLSGTRESALIDYASRYLNHLEKHPEVELANLCYTANARRTHFGHRIAIVFHQVDELKEKLQAVQQEKWDAVIMGNRVPNAQHQVAFLFTGQGAQYVNMGKRLYETQPTFRNAMDACNEILTEYLPKPILEIVFQENAEAPEIHQTQYTQPALFSIEYALAQLWMSWGIQPQFLIGHSVGEYVAACISGVFSLHDGLKLIAARGRLMQQLPEIGSMAAVFADEETVKHAILGMEDRLSIAGVNGVANTVISGETEAVREAIQKLEKQGFQTRLLRVSHAFHSPLMDDILDEFEAIANEVTYHPPQIPIVSNVTGTVMGEDEIPDAHYWRNHIRKPVLFAHGIRALADQGVTLFIETGPHPTLIGMARQTLSDYDALWLPSLHRKEEDWDTLLKSVAQLYVHGGPLDWEQFDRDYNRRVVDAPHYPFQRRRYWQVTPLAESALKGEMVALDGKGEIHPFLGRRVESPLLKETIYEATINPRHPAILSDHRILNTVLFPAAGFLETILAAVKRQNSIASPEIRDFVIRSPLVLKPGGNVQLQLALIPDGDSSWQARLFFRSIPEDDTADTEWTEGVTAHITKGTSENGAPVQLESLRQQYENRIAPDDFYALLQDQGFQYGPSFRAVKEIYFTSGHALGLLELNTNGYNFHPGLLDGGFQLVAAALDNNLLSDKNAVFLPVGVQAFALKGEVQSPLWCHVSVHPPTNNGDLLIADLQYLSPDGVLVAEVKGLQLQRTKRTILRHLIQEDPHQWLYRFRWENQPVEPVSDKLSGDWLIMAPDEEIANLVVDRIRQRGGNGIVVFPGKRFEQKNETTWELQPDNASDYQRLLQHLESSPQGIIHLWSIKETLNDELVTDDIINRQATGTQSVLHLAQQLVTRGWNRLPTLWLVTQQTQAVKNPDTVNPLAAPMWGLARTMGLEFPELPCKRIDVDAVHPATVDLFINELMSESSEDQIAYREGQRYVLRLVRLEKEDSAERAPRRLDISQKGLLDNLELVPLTREAPPPGAVEIRVHAAGLNFRDVLNALDLYPGDPGPLGGECAGVVTRVGEGVTHLKPGDAVMAIAGGAFGDYVITHGELAVPKPEAFTFEEAATIPITFLTAYYALIRLGKMKKGDKVLIHVASGGVGQAAIQLAKMVGAEIFATAGSEKKRAFLRDQGIQYVMNSRSLEFAEQIMEATNGAGVDLVLNSLNGEYIPKGLSILSPGGRFLEIGKVGIWSPEQVRDYRSDIEYYTIALDDLSANQPKLVQELFQELLTLFKAGKLKPLPHKVYAIDEAVSAFRYMQQAKHIGKVVITLPVPHTESVNQELSIRSDGAYLVTGGTGGLGLELARWLVQNGAGEVVLVGRNAPDEGLQKRINAMQTDRTPVRFVAADVSKPEDVHHLINTFGKNKTLPLAGVFHAAGVLDDGVLLQQDWDRFKTVFAPKVMGSWNLHRELLHTPVDFIVYFSSMASALGSPGQGNYAAANAFLDALAHYQRSQNMNAMSINWGPWASVGMAARVQKAGTGQGLKAIEPEMGMELLGELLHRNIPQVAVLPIEWKTFLKRFAGMTIPPVLFHFAGTSGAESPSQTPQKSDIVLKLEAADPAARRDILVEYLREQTTRVLGLDPSVSVNPHKPLSEMGLDSLMAIELKNALDRAVGQKLPATIVFNYPTIDDLAGYLLSDVFQMEAETEEAEAEETAAESAEEITEKLKEIEDLSDEEVEKMLLESLEDTPGLEDDEEEDEDQ